MFSALGKLNLNDWAKGFLVAVVSAPLTIVYQSLAAGVLILNPTAMAIAAAAAGTAYILKNLGTGSGGKLLTNDQPK